MISPISTMIFASRRGPIPGRETRIGASGSAKKAVSISYLGDWNRALRRGLDLAKGLDQRHHLRGVAAISCGKHRAGHRVDIHLQGPVMQIFDGEALIKTVLRSNAKEVRKKHAARAS